MRLLLRANSHRRVVGAGPGEIREIAACPDTDGRGEEWQWQVRLLHGADAGSGTEADGRTVLTLSDPGRPGGPALEIAADPQVVEPRAQVTLLGAATDLERGATDTLVLVVTAGSCLAEGRHELHPLDAFILEGDDPTVVSLEPAGDTPTSVAVVRLLATGPTPVGWVP